MVPVISTRVSDVGHPSHDRSESVDVICTQQRSLHTLLHAYQAFALPPSARPEHKRASHQYSKTLQAAQQQRRAAAHLDGTALQQLSSPGGRLSDAGRLSWPHARELRGHGLLHLRLPLLYRQPAAPLLQEAGPA